MTLVQSLVKTLEQPLVSTLEQEIVCVSHRPCDVMSCHVMCWGVLTERLLLEKQKLKDAWREAEELRQKEVRVCWDKVLCCWVEGTSVAGTDTG